MSTRKRSEAWNPRTCLGYGPFEGQCDNIAGTPWTPFWCPRCDEMRRDTLTRRFGSYCDQRGEAKAEDEQHTRD